MTDREWLEGWARVERAFANFASLPREEKADRAAVYREALDDLTGEAWVHGAREAVRLERTTFLPSPGKLREYAETWRPPVAGLLEERRTPEQREVDRETARAGVETIRAALAERGLVVAAAPVKPMPEPVDERMERLRKQAEAFRAEEAASA